MSRAKFPHIRDLQETFSEYPGRCIYPLQDEDALTLTREMLLSTIGMCRIVQQEGMLFAASPSCF